FLRVGLGFLFSVVSVVKSSFCFCYDPGCSKANSNISPALRVSHPLCFDNHPNCSASNPFLLIIMQIARGVVWACPRRTPVIFFYFAGFASSFSIIYLFSIASEHLLQTVLCKITTTRFFSV